MKCYSDDPLVVPIDGLHIGAKLQIVEEPVEIMDREVKRLKQSRFPIVKVRWNSRRGPEFIWEREDRFQKKYPHLFTNRASSSNATSLSLEDKAHLTGGDYNTPCFRVIDVVNKSAMYLLVFNAPGNIFRCDPNFGGVTIWEIDLLWEGMKRMGASIVGLVLLVSPSINGYEPGIKTLLCQEWKDRDWGDVVERRIVEYGVSTSIGYGVSNSLSNTAYSSQQINTDYPLPLDTAYR
ncbi:hypothetical protein Tco_1071050 [Tanacetum coccineum]|uniref:Reverse transcriptase domain-containing protein n=1 Tax=Tanacetum coccineum TaxID=301880 RepID=A0ABQ5HQB6_9ASTR